MKCPQNVNTIIVAIRLNIISFFNPFLLYRNNSRLGNNNIPIGSKLYFNPNLKINITTNADMDIRIFEYVMCLIFIVLFF